MFYATNFLQWFQPLFLSNHIHLIQFIDAITIYDVILHKNVSN